MANFNEEIKLVVGIDFGTSFCSYAYSYVYEKDNIHVNSTHGSKNSEEATAILFDQDKKFIAFGMQAIEKHGDLNDEQEKSWHFFDQFKMDLYQEEVSVIVI